MIQTPSNGFLEWLGGRPETARVALTLDLDRLLCDAGLLGWSTITDTAGREWQVVAYRGDELAFRLRFRKAAEHERRVIVVTRGEGMRTPIDVSTIADILGMDEGGPPLDLSLPAFFRRLIPKINIPAQELRRHKAALLAHLNTVPSASTKIIERWRRPDDWGRGQVAALVFLASQPERQLSDFWPDQTLAVSFLFHGLRALFCYTETEGRRSLLLEVIQEAAGPQVRHLLFWFKPPPEEVAAYLVLRHFAAHVGLQNPSTQLAGLSLFSQNVALDEMEPLALAVAEELQKDPQAWSAIESQAEGILNPRRLEKVMSLLPASAKQTTALIAAVQGHGMAPVCLMYYLRELLLAFCKEPASALAWVSALQYHPILSDSSQTGSSIRDSCHSAVQFLLTASRIEVKLARPVPAFSHPEALLDWYVQEGLHRLELETAQAMHLIELCGDEAVSQEGHHYLFGASDDLSPEPASLKGRVRQRLQELDLCLAEFVRPDPEAFTRRTCGVLRLLKQHLSPVIGNLAEDGSQGRVWILLFDGMRYDTWETVVQPLFAEHFRIEDARPWLAVLPSYTGIARTSLFAGCLPPEWRNYKGGPTRDEATLAACNLGLTQQEAKAKLQLVTEADTTKARRSLGFRDSEARAINILIYPISDECHDFRGDLAAFNDKIRREIVGDKSHGICGIIDDLLRRVRPEDTVVATSDHGFLELLAPDATVIGEAVALGAGRILKEDLHHRYACEFNPTPSANPVAISLGAETYTVAVGGTWWRHEGETKSPRYDHGGLSLAEMTVPGAVLRRVTEKEARAELQGVPAALSVAEDAQEGFSVTVLNGGNVALSYDLLAQTNLGEDLGMVRGHLLPGETATHKWAVVGRYRQDANEGIDRRATLTFVSLRLRHTDLQGQWRDAAEGTQTVPVKVKPKKTKLDTDALRSFDDL
jgi:PglZ domain